MHVQAVKALGFPALTMVAITGLPTPHFLSPPGTVYNCGAFTVGVENDWIWPPDVRPHLLPIDAMDDFYGQHGFTRTTTHPQQGTVVALYGFSLNAPQHVALWLEGDWWESKLGQMPRVVHLLDELVGPGYGDILGYYVK